MTDGTSLSPVAPLRNGHSFMAAHDKSWCDRTSGQYLVGEGRCWGHSSSSLNPAAALPPLSGWVLGDQ